MPMFDNPNKELQWLQDELLAAEEDDAVYDDYDLDDLDDLLRDYDDEEEEYEEDEEEEDEELAYLLRDYEETPAPRRQPQKAAPKAAPKAQPKGKSASPFGKKAAPVREALDEDMDDSAVYYRDDYRKAKKKEKNGNRGLLIIIALEIIAIIGILFRWLTWLI